MTRRVQFGAVLVAWMAWGTAACVAQSAPANIPAPCTVAPQPEPCGTKAAPAKPDTAQKFPFPGETSPNTAPAPNLDGVPEAPDGSGSGAISKPATPPAAKQFPFPGEASRSDSSGTSGGSSSSSSSGDDSIPPDASGAPGLKDKGSDGNNPTPGRHLLHRVNPVGTKLQTPEEREAEDLDIAHYYTQTGDLKGAYLRGQDAVKTAPDDPDAHFALAEIAQKLDKRDEAIAEYNACLKLDATDKQMKAARKALERLRP